MSNYVKLFGSILDSTVWKLPPAITKVWITMLAMADRNGLVEASLPGLANRARVPINQVERAIEIFSSPDPHSKTPDHEGRRIETVPRGWRLINHALYRDMGHPSHMNRPGAPGFDADGHVYFIESNGAIKIGFSQNPWARLNALKTAMATEPVLLGHFRGTRDDEWKTQKQFEKSRRNREWFEPTPDLLEFIAKRCGQPGSSPTGSYPGSATVATSDLICGDSEIVEQGQARVRSEVRAIWTARDWLKAFARSWTQRYGWVAYGHAGDTRACGTLGDMLASLPEADLLAAQSRAGEMFAEYIARDDERTTRARHSFAFFVGEWGSLRVPKPSTKVPESFSERDARVRQDQRDRERSDSERQVAATDAKIAELARVKKEMYG